MFDEEFVKGLPQDILKAQQIICEHYEKITKKGAALTSYLEALAFAQVFVKIHSIGLAVPDLNHNTNDPAKIKCVGDFFRRWKITVNQKLKKIQQTESFELAKDRYASMFGKGFFYEFSDADFCRIQTLLNNLRDLLAKSKDFEEGHRIRLFKKLEALQAELHKKMSDFDRFWGFFIDSGIALGKFWENAKPFRDDVKEIIKIISHTQAKAENLQNLFPLNLLKGGDVSDSKSSIEQIEN